MRCNTCGAEIDDGTKTCPYCGCGISTEGESTTVYTAENAESEAEEETTSSFDYVNSFKNAQPNPYKKPETTEEKVDAAKLTWAKVLKWIMVLSILRTAQTLSEFLTGAVYRYSGVEPDFMYANFGAPLKYLDTFYEIVLALIIVIAIFAIVALSRFKESAGFLVVACYAGSIISGLAIMIGRTVIFGMNNFTTTALIGLAVSTAMMIVNIVYFKKAKHIFVN